MSVNIKRIYEAPSKSDGKRILVDRLWPRGMTKEKARLDAWMKDLAPSGDLRKRFHHDIPEWPEFKKLYEEELGKKGEELSALSDMIKKGIVTLVYSARDEEHNNAVVLREFLEKSAGIPQS